MLVTNIISLVLFFSIGLLWLLGSLIFILGPESITEITIWNTSIKRDVKAAAEIRDEVTCVREELRQLTKGIVEEAYILASCSSLAMGADQKARDRLENNLDKLSKFAEPIKEREEKWWAELHELFQNRNK